MNENFIVYGISVEELVYRDFRSPDEIAKIALELGSRRDNDESDNSRQYLDK